MNLWEIALGCLLGSSGTIALFYFQKSPAPQIVKDEEEVKHLEQKLTALSQEIEPLQKNLHDALERKESYKKLLDIHQCEIERLKTDHQKLLTENITKSQRIAQLELYLEDPTVFSHPDKELEFLHKQLKVQYEEKCKAFEELRSHLLEAENRYITLQKELEEIPSSPDLAHLKALEEEKQRLEELVTQLSVKKRGTRKKAVS